MFYKSPSTPNFSNLVSKTRMVKSQSLTNMLDIADTSGTTLKWNNSDIEHVSPFVPIKNIAKCLTTHTFPLSLVSDSDDSQVDMSTCLAEPDDIEKIRRFKIKHFKIENVEENKNTFLNKNEKRGRRYKNEEKSL